MNKLHAQTRLTSQNNFIRYILAICRKTKMYFVNDIIYVFRCGCSIKNLIPKLVLLLNNRKIILYFRHGITRDLIIVNGNVAYVITYIGRLNI